MKEVLILKCSPRAGGVSDALADFFRAGAGDFPCMEIALREKRIVPCQNCGACAPFPHCCPLDALDDCREIFDALEDAPWRFLPRLSIFMPCRRISRLLSIGGRGFGRHGKQEYARRLFSP